VIKCRFPDFQAFPVKIFTAEVPNKKWYFAFILKYQNESTEIPVLAAITDSIYNGLQERIQL
jgi:hypothetical protein